MVLRGYTPSDSLTNSNSSLLEVTKQWFTSRSLWSFDATVYSVLQSSSSRCTIVMVNKQASSKAHTIGEPGTKHTELLEKKKKKKGKDVAERSWCFAFFTKQSLVGMLSYALKPFLHNPSSCPTSPTLQERKPGTKGRWSKAVYLLLLGTLWIMLRCSSEPAGKQELDEEQTRKLDPLPATPLDTRSTATVVASHLERLAWNRNTTARTLVLVHKQCFVAFFTNFSLPFIISSWNWDIINC